MTTFDASKHRRDARGRFAAMQGSEPTVVFGSDDDTSSAQRPGGTSDVSLDRFDNADAPPTYVDELGNKLWEVDGKSHRSGGLPAVERADGAVEYWVDGGRHGDDGLPAAVEPTGYKEYWVYDRLHRENGLSAIGSTPDSYVVTVAGSPTRGASSRRTIIAAVTSSTPDRTTAATTTYDCTAPG